MQQIVGGYYSFAGEVKEEQIIIEESRNTATIFVIRISELQCTL